MKEAPSKPNDKVHGGATSIDVHVLLCYLFIAQVPGARLGRCQRTQTNTCGGGSAKEESAGADETPVLVVERR